MTQKCNTQADCFRELARDAFAGIYDNKPVFFGDVLYDSNGLAFTVEMPICQLKNAKTLSWNSPLLDKPALPEGFIPHDGGECPVDGNLRIDAAYSDLFVYYSVLAGHQVWRYIIGYKVIKPATVMVELTVEDAEALAEFNDSIATACRKALEERNRK